ncbi:myosin IC heavy chain-like [Panicum virgatum]|uniref:myosin IC heavy chain-like n=1 Tax=Panicum virgatum TaxID=38727 RepID=UPI0019D50C32|nr:myosin IC heavy chain-like [Panicum virgatum]
MAGCRGRASPPRHGPPVGATHRPHPWHGVARLAGAGRPASRPRGRLRQGPPGRGGVQPGRSAAGAARAGAARRGPPGRAQHGHGEGGQAEASVAAARRRDAAAAHERPHPVADDKA